MNVEDKTHIVNTWIEHQHTARALGKIPEETFWACEKLYDIVHQQPELAWELILEILTTDQSNVIYENLAAGALEDLLVYHGDEYIDKVEEQAKQNPNFNELPGGVWKNSISEKIWSRVEKAGKNVW